MLKVFADAGLSARRQTADGVVEFTCHLPDRAPTRLGTLSGGGRRAGEPGGGGEPAPCLPAGFGGRRGRGPQAGHRRPRHLAQHRHWRLCGTRLCGQPVRHSHGRGALPAVGHQPPRASGSGGDRRAAIRRACGGRRVRAARGQSPGRNHRGAEVPRAPTCWPRAAGMACGWSARTASASPCRASDWTPPMPPVTRHRA